MINIARKIRYGLWLTVSCLAAFCLASGAWAQSDAGKPLPEGDPAAMSRQSSTPREPVTSGRPVAEAMAQAARTFIAALSEDQRATALFEFEDEARVGWHYIPKRNRKGLAFNGMTVGQSQLVHALLGASLSSAGYGKAVTIMSLEQLVKDAEVASGRTFMLGLRDSGLYYTCIFGEPSADGTWGWSIEGHHISLNFTVVAGEPTVFTPHFFGAEPHHVVNGPRAGLRALGAEEDAARALLVSLDESQRAKAILGARAPRDIFTRNRARAEPFDPPEGIAAVDLNREQLELLIALIEPYVRNVPHEVSVLRQRAIQRGGVEAIHFAWIGDTEPGIGHPHYYRIQGPEFMIEYDNFQNDANHSHTVWRDFAGDFGRDLLAEHHARDHDDEGAAEADVAAEGAAGSAERESD